MDEQIKKLASEHEKIEKDLQSPEVLNNPKKLSKLSKKYNELNEIMEKSKTLDNIKKDLPALKKDLEKETDNEMKQMTEDEIKKLEKKQTELKNKINEYINPADPLDKRNIILENSIKKITYYGKN